MFDFPISARHSRWAWVCAWALFILAAAPGNAQIQPAQALSSGASALAGIEPLGPSSRRTDLIVSEIMYRPRERADGRNLEFVEVYNAGLIFEHLGGYRLSGAVDYVFPAGTVIPAGGFLVVARVPADIQAAHGLATVLGPYQASLQNDSGTVRLRNELGAILLEAVYGSDPPWPAAADGGGHSLILARPSYGESDTRAWSASGKIGGSPGGPDAAPTAALSNLRINEFLAHTDDPLLDFIELYNYSAASLDISGCWLTDDPRTNKFQVPAGTVLGPRGFAVFNQNQLGFALAAAGETILLLDPDATRVVDAVKFSAQANGVASGRCPDGAPTIRPLARPTPAAPNAAWRPTPVVINEIMFNPISGDDADEYIEIYNRSAEALSLAGWRFVDGVSFRFPPQARVEPGGFVVVAKDAARLMSRHPQLNAANTLGNYEGTLSNSGERVALAQPEALVRTNAVGEFETNLVYVVVSEVTYAQGGRWERYSDGGGSSLELIDPDGDILRPSNWADSDETAKAPWTLIETRGRLDNGHGGYPPNSLQILAQGPGEFLVDNVEVLTAAGVNTVTNGLFADGSAGWFFQGNHDASSVNAAGGFGDNGPCLQVRAPGRGDTGANRIRTSLAPGMVSNQEGTIRARVRWLAGHPEALLRLRGNWLEAYGRLELPLNLGTPGARNSRAVANAGPAVFDVTHAPAVPAANQAVVITARVSDPDGIASVLLRYRVDPSATLTTLAMNDGGTGGDAVAGDGLYSATLPGRASGVLVAFRVEATDGAVPGANALFPSDAPARECLVRWGETVPAGTIPSYRFWNTQATRNAWNSGGGLNNTFRDGTFVYGAHRVIYNMGVHDKGSPFHSGRGDYFAVLPDDDPLLGETDLALVSTGNAGDEATAQREQAAHWIGRQLGIAGLHRRFIHLYANGSRHRTISEDAQEPNGRMVGSWHGEDGDLYKVEDWFEFPDSPTSFASTDATLQRFTTTGGQLKQARYRWSWRKRAIRTSANDYSNLLELVEAVNATGAAYTARVEALVDVEDWLRNFALQHIVGNWDAYGYNRGKNCYAYKSPNGRWHIIPWDIDFVLGSGSDSATTDIFGANDPVVRRMYSHPPFRRAYLRAMLDAINGPLSADNITPMLDAKYRALLAHGINVQSPAQIMTYVNARRNFLLTRTAEGNAEFAISSNSGNDFSTDRNLVVLQGTAPLPVAAIEVNGTTYPVTWTTVTGWTLAVPLPARDNALTVRGLDRTGQALAGAVDSIRVTYTGAPVLPLDQIVFNEIMYHPAASGASFIELLNLSTSASFDLSNWRVDGVGFTFPHGVVIGPGAYVVIAKNAEAFRAAYGSALIPAGEFPGSLDNGGETLRLVAPGASPGQDLLIDEVRYDDDPPWPRVADGFGPSLQLIDPALDNWRAANWGASATNAAVRFTPGARNSNRVSLAPFPDLWINEVLPENVAGPTDGAGERDPWIEIYNAGSTPIDLGGLYLSDSAADLARWRFPVGSTLLPRSYRMVWADGQPAQGDAGELHASFRLAPGSGQVFLSRIQNGEPAALDYLGYELLAPGRSFGSVADGRPQERRILHFPTAAAPNNPASAPIRVLINEWMAGNTRTIADPSDGDYDDWFELYNDAAEAVDLSGYYLTDDLTNSTKFAVPNGTRIAPGGFLLVWADEETGQNGRHPDLHVNFRLALAGESIGLFAPDGSLVDSIAMGVQTNDVSQGRFPDGTPAPFTWFELPSPGSVNVIPGGNQPPLLAPIGDRNVDEMTLLSFQAVATDVENHPLSFALGAGAPAAASIEPDTGVFAWTPAEADGPGDFTVTIIVRDQGTPPRSDAETIIIRVREVNRAPVLAAIEDQSVNEIEPLLFVVQANDPDIPLNRLRFELGPGAPVGMNIHPDTGEVSWTPDEQAGGKSFRAEVRVTDDGQPRLTHSVPFQVRVHEIPNPPIFAPIFPQQIAEGTLMSLQLEAADPDDPPSPVRYALGLGAPPAMTLDPVSGLLQWQTSENDGPSTNIIVVHAHETATNPLTGSFTFVIVVDEVNQPPVLLPVADIRIEDGTALVITNRATDPDWPPQALQFSLGAGAPAGMTIDSGTGVLAWRVPADAQGETLRVTVVVTDDAEPPRSTMQSFNISIEPQWRVLIHEVQNRPAVANAEFVELFNSSARTPHDLSMLRLTGTGFEYVFPPNSRLAPGGFAVIVGDRNAFAAAYGLAAPVLGAWSGALNLAGDTLRLIRPGTGGRADAVLDEVQFSAAAPWPQTSIRGASLQVVDARRDNLRVGNWDAASGLPPGLVSPIIAITNLWRYHQTGVDLGVAWRAPEYDDSAWPQGRGLLYVENATLTEPKSTPLTLGRTTYYFRARFDFPGNPAGTQLKLRHMIDDGAVVYLNGFELLRINMPEGEILHSTFAANVVGDATLSADQILPANGLRAGSNTLAVEVHQVNEGSSDIVFGLRLDIAAASLAAATPGAVNSVAMALDEFPPVWINEIMPLAGGENRDNAGEPSAWVELHNTGNAGVDLGGWWLTDSYAELTRWRIPAGTSISGRGFLRIWLDGQVEQSALGHPHAGIRLNSSQGSIALVMPQGGFARVADFVNFDTVSADTSYGSAPDGQPLLRQRFALPTPGAPNSGEAGNRPPTITPIASVRAIAGERIRFLIGASDPDIPAQALSYAFEGAAPAGATLDSATGQFDWTPGKGQIGLVKVGVRVTDSGAPPLSGSQEFSVVVAPAAVPQLRAAVVAEGLLALEIAGVGAGTYRLSFKDALDDAAWTSLREVSAAPAAIRFQEVIANAPRRFYRIEWLPWNP